MLHTDILLFSNLSIFNFNIKKKLTTPTTPASRRIGYLDSIRGIAALAVVIFHANAWLDFTKDIHFMIIPHENFKETNTHLGFFLGAFGCVIWLVLAMSAPKF